MDPDNVVSYKTAVLSLTPKYFWPTEEGAFYDDVQSGANLNHATDAEALETTQCGAGSGGGYGYYYDSPQTNSRLYAATDSEITELTYPFTLACGFYADSSGTAQTDHGMLFISNRQTSSGVWAGVWVSALRNGQVQVGFGDGTGNVYATNQRSWYGATAAFNDDEWNFIVAGMSNVSTPFVYINGSAYTIATQAGLHTLTTVGTGGVGNQPTFCYGHDDELGNGFIGKIAKPAIWDLALNGTQAQSLYDAWDAELGNGLAVCPRPLYTRIPSDHDGPMRARVPANYAPGTYHIRVPDNWG